MIDASTSAEAESIIHRRSRQEVRASEVPPKKFTIEIQHDTVARFERVTTEIRDLVSPLVIVLSDMFRSLHSLAIENHRTLLEFSTGILIINWIVSNALVPFMEEWSPEISELETSLPPSSTLLSEVMEILNATLAEFDGMAKNISGKGGIDTVGDSFLPPSLITIVGPLTVMILTCIIADDKYYFFATIFAPMMERLLSGTRSLLEFATPNTLEHHQNRRIPDDGEETCEGVLWGMLALFFLESLLVGSIVVLMVLVSLALTVSASVAAAVSPKAILLNPELLSEEVLPAVLVGFLFTWVAGVVMANILRMAIYQAVDEED